MARPKDRDTLPTAPLLVMPIPDPVAEQNDLAWVDSLAREVSTATLTQAQRNVVWRYIKTNDPERAAFLNDPQVQTLIRKCGAAPLFPRDLIRAALAQAKRVAA